MGSQSDWETMRHAAETLARLGVAHESRIVSALRQTTHKSQCLNRGVGLAPGSFWAQQSHPMRHAHSPGAHARIMDSSSFLRIRGRMG